MSDEKWVDRINNLKQAYYIKASKQKFIQLLLSGKMSPKLYATYLWNQHKRYDLLETVAESNGTFSCFDNNIETIKRKSKILEDYNELWTENNPAPVVNSTNEYIKHFKEIMHNNTALMGHMYSLYIGTIENGEDLSKLTPGAGRLYKFDDDNLKLKKQLTHNGLRESIETPEEVTPLISIAEKEIEYVFDQSIKLCEELMELDF